MSTEYIFDRAEYVAWIKTQATEQEYSDLLEAEYILSQAYNAAAATGDCELGWKAVPPVFGIKWKSSTVANRYLDQTWPNDKTHLKTLQSKFYQKFINRSS